VASITAIIPATNQPVTLDACVQAIESADKPPEEVVVVRDRKFVGPAAARNEGARRANGDVFVFVDADVVVHEDAFARLRAAFDGDPDLEGVFGSYDDRPAAPGVVSRFRNLLHHHVHQMSPGPAATFWGGIGALRRETFEEAGGFDELRFRVPSVEDIELGMRLHERGAKIILDPSVQGTHLKAWSLPEMVRTDLLQRGVPWVQLLLERRGRASTLNLSWRHRLSTLSVLIAAVAVARRKGLTVIGACAVLVALNRSFYALLVRRLGFGGALAGVGLHALHLLVAAASVPTALVARLRHRDTEIGW
jgi:glycosyltransferase involved in cell wall biosynthesis